MVFTYEKIKILPMYVCSRSVTYLAPTAFPSSTVIVFISTTVPSYNPTNAPTSAATNSPLLIFLLSLPGLLFSTVGVTALVVRREHSASLNHINSLYTEGLDSLLRGFFLAVLLNKAVKKL